MHSCSLVLLAFDSNHILVLITKLEASPWVVTKPQAPSKCRHLLLWCGHLMLSPVLLFLLQVPAVHACWPHYTPKAFTATTYENTALCAEGTVQKSLGSIPRHALFQLQGVGMRPSGPPGSSAWVRVVSSHSEGLRHALATLSLAQHPLTPGATEPNELNNALCIGLLSLIFNHFLPKAISSPQNAALSCPFHSFFSDFPPQIFQTSPLGQASLY